MGGIRYVADTLQNPAFFLGIITAVLLHFIYNLSKGSKIKNDDLKESKDEFSFSEVSGETKMVLVVRNDLKMGKGKAAAQCSHGAVMAYVIASKKKPELLRDWERNGQRKIVVKAESEGELLQLASEANKVGLVHAIVKDAGLTQILSGSRTVLAVGPGPQKLVDQVTSHLKLF